MPIMKKSDGWYWGSKGPFDTKQKAVQVGQAAHAAGAEAVKPSICIALDYTDCYSLDPEFWDEFIKMAYAKGYIIYCISDRMETEDLPVLNSIGKVIGEENCFFTEGEAKKDYAKEHNLDIDIWIDDKPKKIIKNDKHKKGD